MCQPLLVPSRLSSPCNTGPFCGRDDLPAAFSRKRRASRCILAEETTFPQPSRGRDDLSTSPHGRDESPASPSWNRDVFHQSSWNRRLSHQPSWNLCAFPQVYSTTNHKLYCVHPTNESNSTCHLFSSRSIVVKYFFIRVSCVCKELLSYISTTVCIKGTVLKMLDRKSVV